MEFQFMITQKTRPWLILASELYLTPTLSKLKAECEAKSFLKLVDAGLYSEFSFPYIGCLIKTKETKLFCY